MNYEQMSMGGRRPVPITGTSPVAGPFKILQASAEGCTFAALVGVPESWVGFSLAPGQALYAGAVQFESVQLSAGSVVAYLV